MKSVGLISKNIMNSVDIFNDSVAMNSNLGNNVVMNSVSYKYSRDE